MLLDAKGLDRSLIGGEHKRRECCMGVCYELETAGLILSNRHLSSLIQVDENEAQHTSSPVVAILSKTEFEGLGLEHPDAHESLDQLAASDSNYVDIYPEYIVGSLAVPSKDQLSITPSLFAFYMDRHQLIFVDEGGTAQEVLEHVVNIGVLSQTTTAHCLYVFFKELLVDDLAFLGHFEDKMEDIEEYMLDSNRNVSSSEIMTYRRKSMSLAVYYQEIATMASILSDNENSLMRASEARSFDHIESLADRLATRSETLKEYSLQLHELEQTQIDLKQNSIMQVFTIVTVLFAPLTLVTGWFGMNLSVIPGTEWHFTWLVLVVLSLVCTGALLAFFRWKRWM